MKLLNVLFSAIILSGCAGPVYYNPGASDTQAQRDTAECRYEAQKATVGIRNLGEQIGEFANINSACLVSRGYRP